MRLWWNHLWKSHAYRKASAIERREIEIRFCIAGALKAKRRAKRVTQNALAEQLRMAQSTISKVERASNLVSLDVALRSLLALGCTDAEIAAAFNAGANRGIAILRRRAEEPFFPQPRDHSIPESIIEHRFVWKGFMRG